MNTVYNNNNKPEKVYIPDTRIRIDLWGEIVGRKEFYVNKSYEKTVKRFQELAEREGKSFSYVLCRLIQKYVIEHEPGNPQRPLVDDKVELGPVFATFPVERRRQNVEWLETVIRKNPGAHMMELVSTFSKKSGLRRETVIDYLKVLRGAGVVIERWGKLYHRDNVPK